MDEEQLRQLFEQVREGAVDVDGALHRLRHMPFEDLGFAKVDHHRALRHGMPEVIFGKGKSPDQIIAIAECLLENSRNVLITRADAEAAVRVRERFESAEYFPFRALSVSGATRPCAGRAKLRWSAQALAISR